MQVLIAFFKQTMCNTNALLVDIIRPLPAGARFDFVKGIIFIAWPVFTFQLSRSALSCLLLSRVTKLYLRAASARTAVFTACTTKAPLRGMMARSLHPLSGVWPMNASDNPAAGYLITDINEEVLCRWCTSTTGGSAATG